MSDAGDRVALVEALLFPRSVAIVGASDRVGSWSRGVWEALRRHGFLGPVYPVNPAYPTVWEGERCYPSLAALPAPPDHVVVLVPGEAAIETVRAAGAAGARSATIFASGYGEGGGEASRALGARLAAAIADTGLAISGPNCLGNLSGRHRMITIPDDRIASIGPGPVAVFGQSGGIVMALCRTLAGRGIEVGYAVTSGNEMGLSAADYIRFFAADRDTRVIVCFLEAIRNFAEFRAACLAAREAGKPVVALKIGGSGEAREAALAHTGSLAGSLVSFDAALADTGLIRLDSLDEMIEAVEHLAYAAPSAGPRLGAISFSGGFKALLAEAAERHGVEFPALAPETTAKLRALMGIGTSLGNPLDAGFTALSSAEAYFACIDIMRADPNIDVLLVQEELPLAARANRKVENLREVERRAAAGGKPIAIMSMISYMMNDYSRSFRRELPHLPFLQEPNKVVRAVGAAGRFGALLRTPMPAPRNEPMPPGVAAILARARPVADGRAVLDEAASKDLLRAYGIPVPAEAVAHSADAAAVAAERIGFPVVVKILSHKVPHKSDIGGVVLGLGDAEAVRAAWRRLAALLPERVPGERLDAVLVAAEIAGGVELALGVERDPEVGPVIMFGSGGILLELGRDVAFGPAPLARAEAEALIARTRASRLVAGYRGSPARDRAAILDALVALGRLAADLGDVVDSVDINPFAALPDGKGGYALDALVVLRRG